MNTDNYFDGNKIYFANSDAASYVAGKQIIKLEGVSQSTDLVERFSLEQAFGYDEWRDDVNPSIIYWDNTNTLYNLKLEFSGDKSLLPATALTAGDTLTYFDKIAAGSGGGGGVTNLSLSTITTTVVPVANSNGSGFTIPSATTTKAGVMTAADKTKLDSLSGIANFSATTAYTAGQLVIESNKIYQAIGATPAGAFNPTQWTEISPSGSGPTTNTLSVAGNVLTSTVNGTVATANLPISADGNDKHIVRTNATVNAAPTTAEIPAPVNGDTAKVQLSDGTIEFYSFGTAWVRDFTLTSGGFTQDITLGYATGAATSGTSFESNDNGGISMVLLPTSVALAKVDPTSINVKINKGTAPTTPTTVKIQKGTTVDCITFTIPANATSATVITATNIPSVTFANGDIITCNLSQDCPGLDFGIYFTLIKN